jgi:hypothetical protein
VAPKQFSVLKVPIGKALALQKYGHFPNIFSRTSPSLRWRIAYGCLWISDFTIESSGGHAYRVPLDDLYLFDRKDGLDRLGSRFAKKFPGDPQAVGFGTWPFQPCYDLLERYTEDHQEFLAASNHKLVPDAHFDFLPTSKQSCLLFLLWKGNISVWKAEAKWSKERGFWGWHEWQLTWSKTPIEQFTPGFREWFQVYGGKDGSYYFVTQSGKFYVSSKPAKGERKAEAVWTDAKVPIKTVISDTASGKEFAFALPAGKTGQPVYFELAGKITPIKFDPKAIKLPKVEEPLKTVLGYARFLLAEKKIAGK